MQDHQKTLHISPKSHHTKNINQLFHNHKINRNPKPNSIKPKKVRLKMSIIDDSISYSKKVIWSNNTTQKQFYEKSLNSKLGFNPKLQHNPQNQNDYSLTRQYNSTKCRSNSTSTVENFQNSNKTYVLGYMTSSNKFLNEDQVF